MKCDIGTSITNDSIAEVLALEDILKEPYTIGCVADDFTGASDAASFLMSQGLKTILCNGIPTDDVVNCDAIVIALKSRTQPTNQAVADSEAAFNWLKAQGAKHLYFKYCSTFDSTKEGNIGPVTDMVLEKFGQKYTIIAPALPINGRIVKDGSLYVNGVPLHQTHMKDHPLTPMWAANLGELMAPQGKYDTLELHGDILAKSKDEIMSVVEDFGKSRDHFYIVPDFENDQQGEKIVEVFGDLMISTGGSGILAPMAKKLLTHRKGGQVFAQTATPGPALLLSGSCSKATLEQVEMYKKAGHPTIQMNPLALVEGRQTEEELWAFIAQHPNETVLVYSSDSAENVAKIQTLGKKKVADILERTTANLAKRAVNAGYTRIIVAGGETSSAVVQGLGCQTFEIGTSIAPGVPVMAPLAQPDLRVALKSGNFGQPDFFQRALDMTGMTHLEDAVWVAQTLFQRNKATGSSANLSVRVGDTIYITASGTCFGRLTMDDFSQVTLDGVHIGGRAPSKEFPLHQMLYQKDETIRAVVHTHSTYATLWSCLGHENKTNCVPNITPYLQMKVGNIGLVPYEKPGSEQLFAAFGQCVAQSDGFLLSHHGPIVGDKSVMDAFYGLEELEESCHIAWELREKQILD